MEKNSEENRLEFSEPLSYRFGLPLEGYYIDRFMYPESLLFMDVVKYLEKQDGLIDKDALNSMQVFAELLLPMYNFNVNYLYNIDWNKIDIEKYRNHIGVEIDEYFDRRVNYNELADYGYYDKVKGILSRYPNIRSIVDLIKDRDDLEIKNVLAGIYLSSGKFVEAIRAYEKKETTEPYDCYNSGTIYLLERNDYQKAREYYNDAKELQEARYNLGITYIKGGNWKKAAEQFSDNLAEPCPIDNNNNNERIITVSDFISSEKLYADDLLGHLLDDTAFAGLWVEGIKDNFARIGFHKTKDSESQILPLEFVIKQMACNNIGVCLYNLNDNSSEALGWFETALSWEEVTGLKIGRRNIQRLTETLIKKRKPVQYKRDEFAKLMIGESAVMKQMYELIKRLAIFDSTVLITGETGTGKELVATAIQKSSRRKDNAFIKLNSAAIPQDLIEAELFGHGKNSFTDAGEEVIGLLEAADKGTFFFDEICEMSMGTQTKLLRVIEDGEIRKIGQTKSEKVDIRIIAATNRNISEAVKEGKLREDLYYRLRVCEVEIPPLRERKEDIPLLVEYFANNFAIQEKERGLTIPTISDATWILLDNYDWPGNVRELRNAIESIMIRIAGSRIEAWHFPKEIREIQKDNEEVEKTMIIDALKESKGSITKARKILEIEHGAFYRKLEKYKIDQKTFKNN